MGHQLLDIVDDSEEENLNLLKDELEIIDQNQNDGQIETEEINFSGDNMLFPENANTMMSKLSFFTVCPLKRGQIVLITK